MDRKPATSPVHDSTETFDDHHHHSDGKRDRFWTTPKKLCAAILLFICAFLIIFLPLLVKVIAPKLAQNGINEAELTVNNASILDPQNSTFNMALAIKVSNAKYKATLTYTSPITVWWVLPGTGQQPLLSMNLPPFSVDHSGNGDVNVTVRNVTILNQALFAQFNQYLIASPSFRWRLVSTLSAHALGRDYGGLNMDKTITVPGMSGLSNTVIDEFQLLGVPSISAPTPILMNATLVNNSPVGLSLGIVVFNVTDATGAVVIGNATSVGTTIVNGSGQPTKMILSGFIQPLGTLPPALTQNLTQVLFGAQNLTVRVTPESIGGADPVSWVQGGLKGLPLLAIMGKAPAALL
ncbi:hypothetical protein HKX48_008398 [Thoreauomyces humboldtii]|nr:hypothetical protein HKX48_008398 [Thoreauomyces humboldtii]